MAINKTTESGSFISLIKEITLEKEPKIVNEFATDISVKGST